MCHGFLETLVFRNMVINRFCLICSGAGNRYKMQQLQQKDWCEQQIAEKNSKKQLEKDINNLFDQQTIEFNNILKQTQDQHNKTRR